jgi:hypothetical protein
MMIDQVGIWQRDIVGTTIFIVHLGTEDPGTYKLIEIDQY